MSKVVLEKLRNATLVFLIKRTDDRITEICLAMKKRGFGINRWNGVGGKVETNETIEQAAKRETKEEIGVDVNQLIKVAELSFYFPHNHLWNQMVHVYFTDDWKGEPIETEEMNPKWFDAKDIPYSEMWPDDEFWVPQVLEENLLQAKFVFGKGDVVIEKQVDIVESI
ncbi:8-oxo-dGTP diphosphatase [Candidatus Kuenenbacteria bacterium]|nr:8-oxo-dGTP diphosphatase [Candidatus Kuenenbacteria bacterium]